jgi:uncharacterized protein (DUF111 family)
VEVGSVLLECTLDDITGEQLAHAIGRLVRAGAADAHALFGMGKKGRPLFVLRVVCAEGEEGRLARLMARETGTMGVKAFPFSHMDFEKKSGKFGGIITKSTEFSSKFEFESLKKKSRLTGIPLRELARRIKKK